LKKKLRFSTFLSFLFISASAQHPTIGGYNVYYGDLHNHSNVSDGTGTPASAYNYAKNTAHLDFFSLSDHSDQMTSAEWADIKNQANTYNENGVFTAFYGFEWSSNMIYGNNGVINTDDYCSVGSPTDTFEGFVAWLASRPNGIAFFNHPGKENYVGLEFNYFTTTPSDQLVGIELWNRGDAFDVYYYNDGYYPGDNKGYFDEALERGWKIGAMGANDNHSGTWGTAYPYRMAILSNNLTRADLLAAMQARRFFSTLDKNLSLSFKINGMEMGSTIEGSNFTVQIQARDADGEIFNQVVLYNKNHDIVNTWSLNTSAVDVSLNLNSNAGDYYYVKIRQSDGDEAISSPIWISGSTSNKYPICSISSPSNGISYTTPANITITASATDPDGYVSKVEFYQGTTKLGEDLTSPYTFTWNGVTPGSYSLRVKATDDLGASSTSSAVSVTVIGIPITVTADSKTKIYGGSDPTLTYRITSGSLIGSDTFSGSLTRDAGENVGNHTIRQGTLALDSKYTLTFITGNLSITARSVTVGADAKSKIYGNADPPLTYGIITGTLVGADAFSGSLSRDTGEDIGTYHITLGTLRLGSNYNITFVGAEIEITSRPITVSANNVSKVYGDADHLTYRITSGSLVGTDNFTGSLTRNAGESIGNYSISIGTLALVSNYSLTFIGANLSIIPRALTVTADNTVKVYGDSDVLTYKITSGILAGSDSFTGTLLRDPGENVGTYSTNQGTLALNSNYSITFRDSTLTITPRSIIISPDAKTKIYGESDPELTYKIISGELIKPDAFNGSLNRDAGEDIGSYLIRQGNLALSANYLLTFSRANLDITPRPITVSADPVSKVYGETDPLLTYRITSGYLSGSGDAFIGVLTRESGEVVGTYKIKKGTLEINNNYDLTFTEADFSISRSEIVITAESKSKVYGEADPELTYQITSGVLHGEDKIEGELARDQGESVGIYEVNKGTLELNNNYEIVFKTADLEITARPVSVSADLKKKVIGEPDPDLTYHITSGTLVGEDSFSGILARKAGEAVGNYPIGPGTLTLSNDYELVFSGADLIITADFEIKTYPNPFTDNIHFEVELNYEYDVTIEIFNQSGFKIATVFHGKVNSGFHRFDFVPRNANRGFLVYKITINGHIMLGKLIHI
jgi:hypothetical protein